MSREGYYPSIPPAPQEWQRIWAERVSSVVNLLVGKANCTLDKTLNPNAVTTTLTDVRIHPGCVIDFMALTANAATAKAGIWVSAIGKGTAIIHHASSANTDQNFRVSIVG